MRNDHVVLAGGGHSHALLLKHWAMRPELKPCGLITLVNRQSNLLYSGMLPGLIAGYYRREEIEIDLHTLCIRAGISFVISEIIGIDINQNLLKLSDRESIRFDILSLDVGSETFKSYGSVNRQDDFIDIKPLENALAWLNLQDEQAFSRKASPLKIIGAGMTGIEVSLALRKRWPKRRLLLKANSRQPALTFRRILNAASIELVYGNDEEDFPSLFCTGSKTPDWLVSSGLPVNSRGRVKTSKTLQVIGQAHLFAVGDCGVINCAPRPPSGVWAVKAASTLACNLELFSKNLPTRPWTPPRYALQLLGVQFSNGKSSAWAVFGKFILGPYPLFWLCKKFIDERFIAGFKRLHFMDQIDSVRDPEMFCRGCAAKLSSRVLNNSLQEVGLGNLSREPEDAAAIASISKGETLLQSVDGFPSLISDPWLNGRITALHACSDIWASGGLVRSAQAVITLPAIHPQLQQKLLSQTLAGMQSALKLQGAELIGGHTQEARHKPPEPCTLGVSISITINGILGESCNYWAKGGLQPGDNLLLSRSIGSGVLFAASMQGAVSPGNLDNALCQMGTSQHFLVEQLLAFQKFHGASSLIHACTDVTGFGLLGHLGEMITATNCMRKISSQAPLRIALELSSVPALAGSLELLQKGFSSTFAPENRYALDLLKCNGNSLPLVDLELGSLTYGSPECDAFLELLIDPQTCGPLLIACPEKFTNKLLGLGSWVKIGHVKLE